MIRALVFTAFFMAMTVYSEIVEKDEGASNPKIPDSSNFALSVKEQDGILADLAQEGQSDVVVRAKRYYGCGCGCGCATVAVVTAVPCYGCCGCGYGK